MLIKVSSKRVSAIFLMLWKMPFNRKIESLKEDCKYAAFLKEYERVF